MENNKILLNADYRVIGFVNTGNSCFLNSAMQIIKAVGPLRHISLAKQGKFLLSIQESFENSRILINPTSLWNVVELFLGYTPKAIRQNCACEFLRFFLLNLDEEIEDFCLRKTIEEENWLEAGQRNISQSINFRAKGKSILYDMIGLCLKTEARAKGHSSITYQEELVIALQAESKLFISLDKYFTSEYIDSYLINGVPNTCKSTSLIDSYNPYLIFHIQRFRVEKGRVFKIKKFVEYPKNFRIPNKYLTPRLRLAIENQNFLPPVYELKGIVEHHGDSANSGHYTTVIRNQDVWLHIDDQVVRPVSLDFVKNRNAYILLYQQANREYL